MGFSYQRYYCTEHKMPDPACNRYNIAITIFTYRG